MKNAAKKDNPKALNKNILAWGLIIAVNVIIAATVIAASIGYFSRQVEERYEAAEKNFSSTISTMSQVAYGYLHAEQTFCDNWATYINTRKMDIDTSIDFVANVNTDKRVTACIIKYDTLEGFCAEESYSDVISYEGVRDAVMPAFEKARTCRLENSHLHITRPFVNPVNGITSLGFCHDIDLVDEDGNTEEAVLIRLLPVSEFQGKWKFPTSYDRARVALIDGAGEFIVNFESVKNTNFFEYIAQNNSIGDKALNELKKTFASTDSGDLRYLNKSGVDSCYSYCRLEDNEEWMLVGYVQRENLDVTPLDLTIATIIILGFLVLMLLDGIYIIAINRHLKTSMDQLKTANEAKTRFLSSMSHDIRTPMNAIIGMTTIAAKRIEDPNQVKECLNQITRASNHLLTLINDVLDISQVESGKLSLNPAVFSLAEAIGNIISIAQPPIKEKNMDFRIHARHIKYEYVYADNLRINQILINLISNAIKYTPEGGSVLLDFEEQPSDKGANMVKLICTVADTGIGISEEFMKTMYDTFTRDVDSRINTIQGAGLGLAITKQMVDIMDGSIDVKSKLGEGTTFTVTLDLPIAEKMTDDLILPPMRILVADDDEIFLESAEDTLKSLGLDVNTVTNGEDAVKEVSEHHDKGTDYRCVIIDWKMPHMNGMKTVKAIREKVGEDVSVIIVSAYDWTEIEDEAIKAGANGFISKPLFRSTVYDKLNELLKFDDQDNGKSSQEDNHDDLKGLNVLIAEDNDINWDIIQVMLEFYEITAERAENGRICVDKINAAPEGTYDAILMDIQMPVLNGNDAAREIRKSDKEYVKNIPIIAMTANAFAEDVIASKEAGMNGHVSKPIDMQNLIKELRSALKENGRL